MKTIIIIPSRLSASRLPGKPLLKINGLSIISHVLKKAQQANIGDVVVATEDNEILEEVKKNGGQAILTAHWHKTGTDRIYEALQKIKNSNIDLIMNLQGDEPLINIDDIKNLNNQMIKNESQLGTLASRIYSPNVQNHKKIYFNLLKNKKKELYPYLISAFSKEEIISRISSQIKIIKYATITLRDYGFNPARNTSSKDIKIALSYAKSKGLSLILVPDEIKNLDNYDIPKEIIIYSRARESLKERVGLYSYSDINIFPPCGAANISLFTRSSKTIILKFGDPKSIDSSSKYYKETYNINYGQQPYQGLKGYLDWYTNKYENLDYQIQIPRNFFDV